MVQYRSLALSAIVIVFALIPAVAVAQDIENRRPTRPVFIDSRDDTETVDGILEIAENSVIRQEDVDGESLTRTYPLVVESLGDVSGAGGIVLKSAAFSKNSGNRRRRRGAGKRRLSRAKSSGIVNDNTGGYWKHTISESRGRNVNPAGSF